MGNRFPYAHKSSPASSSGRLSSENYERTSETLRRIKMMIRRLNGGAISVAVTVAAVFAMCLQSAGAQTTATSDDGSGAPPNPNPYSYGRFTPSMAILLVIFVVVVFLMGFFAVYIRHCSIAVRGQINPSGIGQNRTSALSGLDPTILTTFPTFTYSEVKSHKIGKNALECAVCLTEFDDEETLRLLPKCDHVFHAECINLWLASHSTCPVCRANLEEPLEPDQRIESVTEPPAVEPVSDIGVTIAELEPIDRSKMKPSNRARLQMTKTKSSGSFSKFPRSHTTGHCLVQPGENMDRFTLKLPREIRNQIMNRALNRSYSVVVLPTENSGDEIGRRGSTDRNTEDRWWWSGLFIRNGSVKGFGSRKDRSGSVKDDKSNRPSV